MNRTPKWLIPVFAVVAAVALGVAGTLIGLHFAAPDVRTQPSHTVNVPVVAPVSKADGTTVGEVIGHRTVTRPGTDGSPISTREQQLIDLLRRAQDPASTIAAHDASGSAGGSGAATSGSSSGGAPAADPCSPATGTPAADCPAGVHGALRSDARALFVDAAANPPATSSDPLGVTCPAGTAADGDVAIGVVAPVPAHYVFRYWPSTGTPADATEVDLSTSDADRAAYETASADPAIAPAELPIQRSCTSVHPAAGVSYLATATATDDSGRTATSITFGFSGDTGTVHPELEVSTIGSNLLVLSAAHTSREHVQFRLIGGDATARDCTSRNDVVFGTGLMAPSEIPLSAGYVSGRHWPAADSIRSTSTEFIPFGTAFLVCARWVDGTGAPASWFAIHATHESSQRLLSPNRLLPTLKVTDATATYPLDVLVSTTSGITCGSEFIIQPDSPLPYTACSESVFGGARHDGSRYYDEPVDSGLDVVVAAPSGDPHHGVNLFTIDAPARECATTCIPSTSTYVEQVDQGDPRQGTITFTLSYDASRGTHNVDWQFGGVSSAGAHAPASDRPSFDVSATMGTQDLRVPDMSVTGTLTISSDRPVDYVIRVLRGSDPALTGCLHPEGTALIRGHLDVPGQVHIPGLCLATAYQFQIQLTDADGHRSLWDALGTDPAGVWPGGAFTTPGAPLELQGGFGLTAPAAASYLSDFRATVGDIVIVGPGSSLDNQCVDSASQVLAPVTHDGSSLSDDVVIHISYRFRNSVTVGGVCGPDPTSAGYLVDETVHVSLAHFAQPSVFGIPGGVFANGAEGFIVGSWSFAFTLS